MADAKVAGKHPSLMHALIHPDACRLPVWRDGVLGDGLGWDLGELIVELLAFTDRCDLIDMALHHHARQHAHEGTERRADPRHNRGTYNRANGLAQMRRGHPGAAAGE